MSAKYEAFRALTEAELEKAFSGGEEMPQHRLIEAIRYSLLAGGHTQPVQSEVLSAAIPAWRFLLRVRLKCCIPIR